MIVPRDVIPEPMIPQHVPQYPVMPADTSIPNMLEQVSKISQSLTGTLAEVQARKQRVEDQTVLADRYLKARQEMDGAFIALQGAPDSHTKAPENWAATIETLSPAWTQDLRPDVAMHLKRELIPSLLEYTNKAQHLQNRALVDNAKATITESANFLEDDASRLDHTDDRAFDGLLPKRTGTAPRAGLGAQLVSPEEGGSAAEGGPTGTADAAVRAEPSQFEQLVNGYVAQGLLSKTEGLQVIQQTKERAAYARAVRLATDSPWQIVDLMTREDDQKG